MTSAFEVLWQEFPQLDHATMVDRMSWAGSSGNGVARTFRLRDGKYVRVISTGEGNKLEAITGRPAKRYETVWKQLGTLATAEYGEAPQKHTLGNASTEFYDLMEELFGDEIEKELLGSN